MTGALPAQPSLPSPGPGSHLRFGEILQDTIDLLRRHFVLLALPFVVLAVVTGAGQTNEPMRFDPADMRDINWIALLPFFALFGLVALAIVVALFFVYSLVSVMTARAALDAAAGREPRALGEQLRDAWPQILPATGTFALALLFVILGFIALVVPGFIVLTALFPLAAVVAAERRAGMAAIKRAWALTKGHRWALFGLIALTALATGLGGAATSWIPVVGRAIAGAVSGVGSAFLATAGALYYHRAAGASPGA